MQCTIRVKLIFLCLIVTTFGLHVHKHSLEKRYDQSKYLEALLEKQDRFQKDIDTLSKQISEVNEEFEAANTTDSVKLSKVQQGIAEERDSLYNIETYLKLPFSLRSCQCRNFTDEKREQMKQKLSQLDQHVQKLKTQVKDCAECPLIVQIKRQIQNEENYINVMQEGLSSECCRSPKQLAPQTPQGLVDINQSLYKDNLGASNYWYYGNMTVDQYVYKTFETTTKYNLTSCPSQKPFALSQFRGCTFCPEHDFFNLQTRQCESCGNFEVFDPFIKKCTKVTCKPRQQFSMEKRVCQECPELRPIFNEKTLKCQPCPLQQAFNKQIQKCEKVTCLASQLFNQTTKKCQDCPKETPRFNKDSGKCERCPLQQSFNYQALRCEKVTCMANQWFDEASKTCLTCPNEAPIYNKTTKQCDACPPLQVFNLTANKCMLYNCPNNQIYNVSASQCQDCPRSHPIYNADKKKCDSCPLGYGYDIRQKVCFECPPEAPEWNGATYKCQNCPDDALWDSEKKLCMKANCPPQFPNFNKQTKKCEVCSDKHVFDELLKKCRLKDTTGICPPSKPIYDSSSYSCQPCPDNSVYNKQKGECEHDCDQGQYFNWQTGQCNSVCTAPLLYRNGTCMSKEEIEGCPSKDQYFDRALNRCLDISTTCEDSEYYSKKIHQCKTIPFCPPGYGFNKTSEKCEKVDYATSPKANNLIYNNKPFSIYENEYAKLKASDPRLRDCPNSHPYYDKDIGKCISCPDSHPYFNLFSYDCQDCGGLQYDAQKRSCHTSDVDVSPTLERLIMNII